MLQLQISKKRARRRERSWPSFLNLSFAILVALAGLVVKAPSLAFSERLVPDPARSAIETYRRPSSPIQAAVSTEMPMLTLASDPEVILSGQGTINAWKIGGGFIYWYENCGFSETEAFLKRRAVNGSVIQTLVDIDDADQCETLIGAAVDDSGFYYYNRATGQIEAKYASMPLDPPTVLATVGQRTAIGFGDGISDMYLDEDYVYWIEVEVLGEFIPDEIRIRRVSKNGGTPSTLLTYEGYFAGYGMGITDGYLWWTDSEGLQRLGKPGCTGSSCEKTRIHSASINQGRIYINEADDIFWWEGEQNSQIWRTRCQAGVSCQTQTRYTAPDSVSVTSLVANEDHIYWAEWSPARLRRMPVDGGAAQTILDDDLSYNFFLAVDSQGVYFRSTSGESIKRLPLDAQAIQREISFGGWEVTQAIQNVQNDVPLVAARPTFVRVYAALDSGSSSSGVEAWLYGSRDGASLPGSPLRPLNGTIAVWSSNALGDRDDVDGGWLFQLPASWTRTTETAIPLEDADLTLRVVIDPRGVTDDTTPANNSAEGTFTFVAKAPTCVNLRPVETHAPYQSPWDISVGMTVDLAESAHPTPRILTFPEYSLLSEAEWCWKGIFYGPFCSGPYELNESWLIWFTEADKLMTKMSILDFFHGGPSICAQETGARTLYAGIVSEEDAWGSNGLGLIGGDQFLSKVLRYGRWGAPYTRDTAYMAMTFVHEMGHNYGRDHIDCPVGRPDDPDQGYSYATDKLDDGPLDAPSTHFGFDRQTLKPIRPDNTPDYMSYCSNRWVSDHTWKNIFDNTRNAGPLFPFAANASASASAYVLVSGLIASTVPEGTLSPIWTYPITDASAGLIAKWEQAVAAPWTDQAYHIRVLGSDDDILTDRAIVLLDVAESSTPGVKPFHVVFPATDAPAKTVQLMTDETVLASLTVDNTAPTVTIIKPQGGETVEDEVTLQWTATDPDDAPWLVYTVQYSPDQGENWYSLVVDHPGPGQGIVETLQLDLRGEPGSAGETALLRVLASDGYNTGLGTSAPFSTLPRAPQVMITAPGEGQWFAADEPILLQGDAFDPEDGVLDDNAFTWSSPDFTIQQRLGTLLGLAPGEHTLTLQATDADGQQDSEQVTFNVAPLDVPAVSNLALDGHCDDLGYSEAVLPLVPYSDGTRAYAFVARTTSHLWVCLQGLQGAGDYAGLQVDVDNSQETAVQAGDLGFFVKMDGTPVVLEGDGGSFAPTQLGSMAAHISDNGSTWRAELRIEASALGGWNRRVALGIGHYSSTENNTWPATATLEDPQSWAQTNLGAGQTPVLADLSPTSAVLGSGVALTVTGSGLQQDTVILWDGATLVTTYVNSSTLQATVSASLTVSAGTYDVQVAPGAAHTLASIPHPFVVHNPQPAIGDLSPASASMEGAGFTLTVNGSAFIDGATVLWNGDPRSTTFISSTRLQATIHAEDLTAARSVGVTVVNPDPSVGISDIGAFSIVRDSFQIYLPVVVRVSK